MRLPKKDAKGNLSEVGDMPIFIAGWTPVYGKQVLCFMGLAFSVRKDFGVDKSDVLR